MIEPGRDEFYSLSVEECRRLLDEAEIRYYNGYYGWIDGQENCTSNTNY